MAKRGRPRKSDGMGEGHRAVGGAGSGTSGAAPSSPSDWQDSPADFTPIARHIPVSEVARQLSTTEDNVRRFFNTIGITLVGRPPSLVNANIADPYIFAVSLPGAPGTSLFRNSTAYSDHSRDKDRVFGEWVRTNMPSVLSAMSSAAAVSEVIVGPVEVPVSDVDSADLGTPTRPPGLTVADPVRASPGTDVVGGRFRLDAFRSFLDPSAPSQGTSDGSLTYDQLYEERGVARIVQSMSRALEYAVGGFVGDDCIYPPAPAEDVPNVRPGSNPSRRQPTLRLAVAEALTDPFAEGRIRARSSTGRLLGPAVVGVVRNEVAGVGQPVQSRAEKHTPSEVDPQETPHLRHPVPPSHPESPRPARGSEPAGQSPNHGTGPYRERPGVGEVPEGSPGRDGGRDGAERDDGDATIPDDGDSPAVPDFGEHTDNVGHRPPAESPDSNPDAFGVIAINDDSA